MNSTTTELQEKISQMQAIYKKRGLPEKWLYDILKDIHCWCVYSLRNGGTYSIPEQQKGWFDYIFSGELLRIGRLEYAKAQFGGRIVVFRRKNELAVLSEADLCFDEHGMRADNGWKSILQLQDNVWIGNPIRNGKAEQKLVRLNADEWEIVLRCNDPMITIHIPEDGPMDIKECQESLKQATEWFAAHDPDWKGFFCQSWLLHPLFQEILPETSNIMQFQNMGYLYPMGMKSDVLKRLYPGKLRDFVLAKQNDGVDFKCGGMFILKDANNTLILNKKNKTTSKEFDQ